MSCDETEEHGAPYEVVAALRSWDNEPIGIDWHDHLIKKRVPGKAVQVGDVFRPIRSEATGMQYRCTTAGVTLGVEFRSFRWPKQASLTLVDGGATWVAEPISTTSLISTINAANWIQPTGITHTNPFNDDLRYFVYHAGGISGVSYTNKHQIVLANGQKKEGVVVVPILD